MLWLGALLVFPVITITMVCLVHYVTCIYCSLSMKRKQRKCYTVHKDRGGINFACVVGKKPKDPQFEPTADNTITQASTQGLGSPLCISRLLFHMHPSAEYVLLKGSYCVNLSSYQNSVEKISVNTNKIDVLDI